MKTLSSKIVYTCPIFRVEERQVKVADGVVQTHWVVVAKPNVSVVALTQDKKIVLTQEIRSVDHQLQLGIPSGKAQDFEITPTQAQELALEELATEAGYRAEHMELLNVTRSTSAYLGRQYYQFVAWDLEFVGQKLEAGEEIETRLVSIAEAAEIIKNNQLDSMLEQEAIKKAIEFFRRKELT